MAVVHDPATDHWLGGKRCTISHHSVLVVDTTANVHTEVSGIGIASVPDASGTVVMPTDNAHPFSLGLSECRSLAALALVAVHVDHIVDH